MWQKISVLAGVLALVAGCGSEDSAETPAACLGTTSDYLDALRAAPGEVRLDGSTSISSCIVPEQEAGQLAQVGQSMVQAATRLNAELRESESNQAALRLGYLLGAVQEAASTTGGIHEDLTLRLDAAANFTPDGTPFPGPVERVLGEGYAAGQQSG